MDIKAIIKKVVSGEEISDEERNALAAETIYNQTELEEEANARAAKARKQAESKMEKLQSDYETTQAELEEAKKTASKSKGEDIDAKMEAVKKEYETKLENLQTDLDAERTEKAQRIRKDKLHSIRSQIGFIEKDSEGNSLLDEGTIDAIVNSNFAEIDTDDLDRKAVVEPVVNRVREKNPHLILDKGKPGTGHKQGSANDEPSEKSMQERQKELQTLE